MDRYQEILSEISSAVQKTYKGQKRSDLKDSDFLFPETRSFPIVTPKDVPDAINNFGRMKGPMTYDAFLNKLYTFVKRKGPAFIAALPKATKDRLNIKTQANSIMEFRPGDKVKNINKQCMHYGSEGVVVAIMDLPQQMGKVVTYKTTNSGETWEEGQEITKTEVQLAMMEEPYFEDTLEPIFIPEIGEMEEEEEEEEEKEDPAEELKEYKQDFLAMNIGSLSAIMNHAKQILDSLSDPSVVENLTESWLQGKIAITEDYMRTIHDFVKFVPDSDDNSFAGNKPGLWDNIRRKKEREGKKYKPAKPGNPDRPDPEQWKRLTK
jgi:hypothetical protein